MSLFALEQLAGLALEHVTQRVEQGAVQVSRPAVGLSESVQRGKRNALVGLRHGIRRQLVLLQHLSEPNPHFHTFANDTTCGQSGQLWPVATLDDSRHIWLHSFVPRTGCFVG